MSPLQKRMLEELQLRNLAEATIHTYLRAVWRFARHFRKSPDQLGPEQVREYLLYLRNDRGDNWNTLQVNRGALKFLYVRVLKQKWFDEEIVAPKSRVIALPTVLTADQIRRILDCTHNLKHWTMARLRFFCDQQVQKLQLHFDNLPRIRQQPFAEAYREHDVQRSVGNRPVTLAIEEILY